MFLYLYGWPALFDTNADIFYPNSNSEVKFSIVIPTLNQAETLEHTLLSIIYQDYKNFEIIVIDGGSKDDTFKIVDKYSSWISYFATGIDSGQSDAINKGFSVATGNIYAWINSDDFYLPHAFSRVSTVFTSNCDVDILVGSGDVITKDCKFLKHIDAMQMEYHNLIRWIQGEWLMQQSCFWTDTIWKKSGGVDKSLSLLMDIDLWFRFAKLGKSIVLNEPLAAMRYYPEIKTVSLKDKVSEEMAYVFAKNGDFDEVRKIVRSLVDQNKHLLQESDRYHGMMLRRILKKIGIKI